MLLQLYFFKFPSPCSFLKQVISLIEKVHKFLLIWCNNKDKTLRPLFPSSPFKLKLQAPFSTSEIGWWESFFTTKWLVRWNFEFIGQCIDSSLCRLETVLRSLLVGLNILFRTCHHQKKKKNSSIALSGPWILCKWLCGAATNTPFAYSMSIAIFCTQETKEGKLFYFIFLLWITILETNREKHISTIG